MKKILFFVSFLHYSSSTNNTYDNNNFTMCIFNLIDQYFNYDCISYIYIGNITNVKQNISTNIDIIAKNINEKCTTYIFTPVIPNYQQVKTFLYPCSYLIHLTDKTDVTKMFENQTLNRGHFTNTISRYVIFSEEYHSRKEIFNRLWKLFTHGFIDVIFINAEDSINIYTLFPFGKDLIKCPENCFDIELVGICKDGDVIQNQTLFPRKHPNIYKGCTLNVSCTKFEPYTIIENEGETNVVRGLDGDVITFLANKLNLSLNWNIHEKFEWINKSSDGTPYGALVDFIQGKVKISCGAIPTDLITMGFDVTVAYDKTEYVWFAAIPPKTPKWKNIYLSFSYVLWISVGTSILFVPFIMWRIRRFSTKRASYTKILLNIWGLSLNVFTGKIPKSLAYRIVLASWLYYSMHINLAYSAALTGLTTGGSLSILIRTQEQLLQSKLPTFMQQLTYWSTLNIEESVIKKIISNYVIIPDSTTLLLKLSQDKNFTLFDNKITMQYMINKHNAFSNELLEVYSTDIVLFQRDISLLMWRNDHLYDQVNNIIMKLIENGIISKITKVTLTKYTGSRWKRSRTKTFKVLKLGDLAGPFYVFIVGISISLIFFLAEIILSHF